MKPTAVEALQVTPHAACPICNGGPAVTWIRRGEFSIVRCSRCGFRFLDPQPTPEQLRCLYGESYFQNSESVGRGYSGYIDEAENVRETFRRRLRHLPLPMGRPKLLDIGAAAGFFVEQARRVGWEACGIEPSEWAARYARERLGQPVTTGTIEDQAYEPATFDVVTMWEVIEHLPDPRAVLAEAHRILKPGGQLILSTPDAGSTVARLSGRRWLGWSKVPEHLHFFDRQSLDRLLRDCGFTPPSFRYVSLTVTWGFAVGRLGEMLGLRSHFQRPGWLSRRTVTINPLYDLMAISART
jgi:SAM-dependent methyltransferase